MKYTFSPGKSWRKEGPWIEPPDRTPRLNAVVEKYKKKMPQIKLTFFEKTEKKWGEKWSPTGTYRTKREADAFKAWMNTLHQDPVYQKETKEAFEEDMKHVTMEQLEADIRLNESPAEKEMREAFDIVYSDLNSYTLKKETVYVPDNIMKEINKWNQ